MAYEWLNAVGSLVDSIGTKAYEKSRYDQERSDMLSNWQMQNAYNSPAAQMERLKQAGLNPNLIYQNGGAFNAAEQASNPNFQTSPLSQFQDIGSRMQSIDSVQAQISKDKSTTRLQNAEALSRESENDVLDKTTLKGFSEINHYQLLDSEARDYYSQLFGMTPTEVNTMSMRWFSFAQQLRQLSQSNQNARQTYSLLSAQSETEFTQAARAKLAEVLDYYMTLHGLSKLGVDHSKLGHTFSGYGWLTTKAYSKDLDLLFYEFNRNLKELRWQSSDFKHTLDSVNQTIGVVGNVIPKFHKGMFSDRYSKSKF